MLAGGADAPIAYGVIEDLGGDACDGAAAGERARPRVRVSRDRQGLVVGEGTGIVILEEWERARARGAVILAELAGYGATADAAHTYSARRERTRSRDAAGAFAGVAFAWGRRLH